MWVRSSRNEGIKEELKSKNNLAAINRRKARGETRGAVEADVLARGRLARTILSAMKKGTLDAGSKIRRIDQIWGRWQGVGSAGALDAVSRR